MADSTVKMLRIDKIYNITDDVMDAMKWQVLGEVYERLPSYQIDSDGFPCWFGVTDEYGISPPLSRRDCKSRVS